MTQQPEPGVIEIHGREYHTVAKRVADFRDRYTIDAGWQIRTIIHESTVDWVVIRAEIINPNGHIVGTGHAEEVRGSTNINKTSALENCETSAIGRALASAGFGGTEFASADEVQQALAEQQPKHWRDCIEDAHFNAVGDLIDANDIPGFYEAWQEMSADEKQGFGSRIRDRWPGKKQAISEQIRNMIKQHRESLTSGTTESEEAA